MRGIAILEESTTYQEILEKGMAIGRRKAARRAILRLGGKRFGPPGEAVIATVEAITELDRLRQLVDRLLDAASWEELLALPH